jgi:uncharacterized protein (DUF2236 family)
VLLAWPRAILLQIAHPLIAAAVAAHSTFRGGPVASVRRLHHTIAAMRAITFGDEDRAGRAIEAIRTIHTRVHGTLAEPVGRFPVGTPYSAEDPDLLLWVHATLVESLPLVYGRFVAELHPLELDAYCDEAASTAIALGARAADVPRTWAALNAYVAGVYASGVLAVGSDARVLAGAVLAPPLPGLFDPAAAFARRLALGTLPDTIRQAYGYGWTAHDARRFARAERWLRRARRAMPAVVALWPEAR